MHDAKSNLSRLVKRAASGEVILIANRGKPMAMLTRIPQRRNPQRRKKIPWNIFKGKIEMSEDFNAPLEEFKDYL